MNALRKSAATAALTLLPGALLAAGSVSEPTQLITNPSCVYWTTLVAENPQMICAWPKTAAQATLTVNGKGMDVTKTYTRGTTNGRQDDVLMINDVDFAQPMSTTDEHLYTLTLTFDNGETRTCKLANTRGGRASVTRVLATDDKTSREWMKTRRNVLIPIIDEGIETVTLNATVVPADLNGACGWYEWLKMPAGLNTFTAGDRVATFDCYANGLSIILR